MELTPDNATFSGFASITGPGFANSVQVTARDGTGATWGLWLAAPQDRQLVAGRYANAANAIQRAAVHAEQLGFGEHHARIDQDGRVS